MCLGASNFALGALLRWMMARRMVTWRCPLARERAAWNRRLSPSCGVFGSWESHLPRIRQVFRIVQMGRGNGSGVLLPLARGLATLYRVV